MSAYLSYSDIFWGAGEGGIYAEQSKAKILF